MKICLKVGYLEVDPSLMNFLIRFFLNSKLTGLYWPDKLKYVFFFFKIDMFQTKQFLNFIKYNRTYIIGLKCAKLFR